MCHTILPNFPIRICFYCSNIILFMSLFLFLLWNVTVFMKTLWQINILKASVTQRLFLETRSKHRSMPGLLGPQLEHWSPEASALCGPTESKKRPLRFKMWFTVLPIMSKPYWSLAIQWYKGRGTEAHGRSQSEIIMIMAKKAIIFQGYCSCTYLLICLILQQEQYLKYFKSVMNRP